MRKANSKAEEASRKWNKLSDFLNTQWAEYDDLSRIRCRKDNVYLSGHFDTWHFWQREVLRLAAMIQTEIMAAHFLEQSDGN